MVLKATPPLHRGEKLAPLLHAAVQAEGGYSNSMGTITITVTVTVTVTVIVNVIVTVIVTVPRRGAAEREEENFLWGGWRLGRWGDFGACGAGPRYILPPRRQEQGFAAAAASFFLDAQKEAKEAPGGATGRTSALGPRSPCCLPPGPPFYGGRQLGSSCGSRKGAGGVGIDVAPPHRCRCPGGFLCAAVPPFEGAPLAWWGTSSSVGRGGW